MYAGREDTTAEIAREIVLKESSILLRQHVEMGQLTQIRLNRISFFLLDLFLSCQA
jgi:hypothetical protein